MLEPDFVPPDKEVSEIETKKRMAVLPDILSIFDSSTSAILVSGSLAYGSNYSVTEKSDIDLQLLVNLETVDALKNIDQFKDTGIEKAIEGFKAGYFQQFSFDFWLNDIRCECHFWSEDAFLDAITYKNSVTPRLRQSIETPSTDFGFSFDGELNKVDYFGEVVGGYPVSDFPTFRIVDKKIFLCRPIANILGKALVLKSNDELENAIDRCWVKTIEELSNFKIANPEADASIFNVLPGKNKVSPEVKSWIEDTSNANLKL